MVRVHGRFNELSTRWKNADDLNRDKKFLKLRHIFPEIVSKLTIDNFENQEVYDKFFHR